jgi:hypothetical protein
VVEPSAIDTPLNLALLTALVIWSRRLSKSDFRALKRRGVQRGVGSGQGLFLHLAQQVGDGVAGGQGHVDGRLAALQRVLHGVQRAGGARLAFGHRPDRAVVFGGGDLLAGVDALLRDLKFAVGRVQVLQGDHRARVRIDAVQSHFGGFPFKVADVILTVGSILLIASVHGRALDIVKMPQLFSRLR